MFSERHEAVSIPGAEPDVKIIDFINNVPNTDTYQIRLSPMLDANLTIFLSPTHTIHESFSETLCWNWRLNATFKLAPLVLTFI